MSQRERVAACLADCVVRLDAVLGPWGFDFQHDGCHASHTGPFASGGYVRGASRIGLSCRNTIDNVLYQHSFVTEYQSWRAIEKFTMPHTELMRILGHAEDCHLICSVSIPDAVVARDGGDRVAAMIYDLPYFVAPCLRLTSERFCDIMRLGWRSYTVV
jgi:hypothetical protein